MHLQQISNNYNNKNITVTSFRANAPQKMVLNAQKAAAEPGKLRTFLAKGIANILKLKPVEKLVENTKDANLVAHLSASTSVVLSGFYIKKTLENDKLDDTRKKILAINQGVVTVLSAFGAYALDHVLDKRFDKFTEKYKMHNADQSAKDLATLAKGIKAAKSIMVFGAIYRFIAPVFATPIANAIGNKMQKNADAEKAAKLQKLTTKA